MLIFESIFDKDDPINTGDYRKNVGQNVGQKLKISERQKNILAHIKVDNTISAGLIAEKLNVAKRTVERDIKKLRELNLLEYVGSSKGGYWKIKE